MLFKDSNTVKKYAQLHGDVDLTGIEITMERVERAYLLPRLGKALFTSFTASYKAAASDAAFGTSQEKLLLDYCRRVIGPLFCYHFAAKTDAKVSNSGVQRMETATSKTAYQYQTTRYREENWEEGQDAIEQLLLFLEDNTDTFTSWATSDEFKAYRGLFIQTASEFNSLYPSPAPQRNFHALRPKMVDVEENIIRPFLGDALYADLKEKAILESPGYTDEQKQLIAKLKKAIAYHTVEFSVPFLSVKITAAGISIVASASFSSNDQENTRSGADHKTISDLVNSCNHSARMWLKNAADYLLANSETFTTWPGNQSTTSEEDDYETTSVFSI